MNEYLRLGVNIDPVATVRNAGGCELAGGQVAQGRAEPVPQVAYLRSAGVC